MATILAVDDRPTNRKFLVTLLGHFDHKVLEAGDGGEALETLRRGRVDLVIADVLMPTMDGYEFLKRMRADQTSVRMPVILYTAAHYEAGARAMAEACGVRHFLTKPAAPEIILAAVNGALGVNAQDTVASMRGVRHCQQMVPSDLIDPHAVVSLVDSDDDLRHSLLRLMVAACLKVESFCSAEDFLEDSDLKRLGCLVTGLCLPGMSGIALLETLRSRRIHIPAIVLTAHGTMATAVDALRLRVVDFLHKPVDPHILLTRVYRALQDDSIKRREDAQVNSIQKLLAGLTARENELLTLLIRGKTSKEIARDLQISVKTVSHHRAHLMAKTGAVNLADLVRMSMIALEK